MSDDVTLNVKGLDQLLKALKAKPPTARVGVLAETVNRKSEPGQKNTPNNAEVGAAHEYGAPGRGLPQRSFLRVPITDNLDKRLSQEGMLSKQTLADVIKTGSVLPWVKKVTSIAKGIVTEAFETGGFGKWPQWEDSHYSNNAGQLLVDTKQLRDSIVMDVKE